MVNGIDPRAMPVVIAKDPMTNSKFYLESVRRENRPERIEGRGSRERQDGTYDLVRQAMVQPVSLFTGIEEDDCDTSDHLKESNGTINNDDDALPLTGISPRHSCRHGV